MSSARRARFATCVAGWSLPAVLAASAASASQLSPAPRLATATGWSSGYCSTDTGVTVVADFTDLDKAGDGKPDFGIVVRCVPGPVQTGVAVLQQAGLSPQGTRQYGLAFICRIAGRPGASEPLAVDGAAGYTEQCDQTPPDAAHWEYWTAPNGGSWTYSTAGAGSHHPIAGGFEGWSFSLNNSHHPPGIAPARPTSPPTSPTPTASPPAPPTTTPTPHRPAPHRPSASGGGPGGPGGNGPAGTHPPDTSGPTSSSPSSRSVAPTPTRQPAAKTGYRVHHHRSGAARAGMPPGTKRSTGARTTTPETDPPATAVSGDIPHDNAAGESAGSAGVTLAGLGLLGVLAAGAGITAWRRSRRV